jgi:hypothetical protein
MIQADKKLQDLVDKLHELIHDPHIGLTTWVQAVDRAVIDVYKAWYNLDERKAFGIVQKGVGRNPAPATRPPLTHDIDDLCAHHPTPCNFCLSAGTGRKCPSKGQSDAKG